MCFQSQSEQQRLQGEVSRLEKEVNSLEQTKRELTDKKSATDQALQSHDAIVSDLKQQLERAVLEKVWTFRFLVKCIFFFTCLYVVFVLMGVKLGAVILTSVSRNTPDTIVVTFFIDSKLCV